MKKTIKAWVSGRVQGVSYRASTQRQAMKLNIDGFAKNLSDGRVEVLISGEETAVQSLIDWLQQGPEHSDVTQVIVEPTQDNADVGFIIL